MVFVAAFFSERNIVCDRVPDRFLKLKVALD